LETGNKIKHFRLLRGFSQEKMAELLGISPKSYGNIERNITDVNLSRLQQIADTLKVSLPKLLDFDEKNIIQGNYNTANIQGSVLHPSAQDQHLAYALEKAQLEIAHLNEKINFLMRENEYLNEIITLSKQKNKLI
jgi:transcriptional regulator with XRE-family HTH domain